MQKKLTTIDVSRLRQQLGRVQIACSAAIELGDCEAVARLTCEAARLRDCISLARSIRLETA
jgi:hypothetical protein